MGRGLFDPDPCNLQKLLLREAALKSRCRGRESKFCSREDNAAGGTAPFMFATPSSEVRFSCEPARDKPWKGVLIPDCGAGVMIPEMLIPA